MRCSHGPLRRLTIGCSNRARGGAKALTACVFATATIVISVGNVDAQNINLVAGTTSGFSGDGGAATSAQIAGPRDVAVDSVGNIYIADTNNHRIRKVTVDTGVITTIAGNGTAGSTGDGGAATAAQLNAPRGVAVDSAGNVYIAEFAGHRIRKITVATGIITTLAGTGTGGFTGDGGPATAAQIRSPNDVVLDSVGNIYFATTNGDDRIRKVTVATGNISTLAGGGGEFTNPAGIALDGAGDIYVADFSNHRVRKVTVATGVVTTIAGTTAGFSGDGGLATAAQLNNPWAVALDSTGNLYITEQGSQRIRKITIATGIITTVAGTGVAGSAGDGASAAAAQLSSPNGIAFDSVGNYYVASFGSHRVRKIGEIPLTPPLTLQTITFGPLTNKTFGDSPVALTATTTSGLPIGYFAAPVEVCDVTTDSAGSRVNIRASGTCTVTARQGGSNTVAAAADVSQSFTIAKASQAINFAALPDKTLGDAPFVVAATSSSGMDVSRVSLTPTICRFDAGVFTPGGLQFSNRLTPLTTGTCTIEATQVGDSRYLPASTVTRSFVINPAVQPPQAQSINFAPISNQTLPQSGTASVNLSATATSGLAVSFASQTSHVCTVSANTATLLIAGTCTIRATQAGNATFGPATPADRSFTVSAFVPPPPPPCESIPTNDCDGDGIPNSVEVTQGTNPLVKDNNIFADTPLGTRLYLMQFYRDVLGREADEAGVQYWLCRMNKSFSNACGASETVVTRADMVLVFLFSTEAMQGRTLTGEEAVARLYVAMLRRNPDPAGLAFWAARFTGPQSLTPLAQEFLNAVEYRGRFL